MSEVAVRALPLSGVGGTGAIIVRATVLADVPNTIQLAPFKAKLYTEPLWFRSVDVLDVAGALTSQSMASDGKSITFTPAEAGEIALMLVGDFVRQ